MKKTRKDGVAVIIVLGLLALLMVLGVAFTVMMRAERAGVSNYVGAVEDRNLVWAGIARAIDSINSTVTNMYPNGDFLVSGADTWGQSNSNGVLLLTGNALDHVPDVLHTFKTERAAWIELDGETRKIAYIVLNLSDMLDINYAGGAARQGGVDPGEIVLDQFVTLEQRDAIRDGRPYNSLPHLRTYLEGKDINVAAEDFYFVTESRFLPDENYEPVLQDADVSGDLDALEGREGEIRDAFISLLVEQEPGRPPQNAFENASQLPSLLFDYLDGDKLNPRNLAGPNMKPVPMINEVYLLQEKFVDDDFSAGLVVKTWHPYVSAIPVPDVDLTGKYSVTLNVDGLDPQPDPVENAIDAAPRSRPSDHPTPIFWIDRNLSADFDIPITTNARTFRLSVRIAALQVEVSSKIVDSAGDSEMVIDMQGTIAADTKTFAITNVNNRTWEVADPRLNWKQDYWVGSTNMPAGPENDFLNRTTLEVWTNNPHLKLAYPLFVSNAGALFSPLELGHLLAPDPDNGWEFSPWHTLRVFNRFNDDGDIVKPRHRILEHFSVRTNTVARGLVNANTFDPVVLKTAFHGIPGLFPGLKTGVTDEDAVTDATVEMLITHRVGSPDTAYGIVADMLDIDWRSNEELDEIGDIALNALASYTTGLLGVRQNLFLVVARAGGGRSKALAVVWRDPIPNAAGLHDSFIQYFQWLD